MDKGIQVTGLFPEILPFLMGVDLDEPDTDGHKRKCNECCRGKNRVPYEHNDGNRNHGHELRKESRNEVIQHIFQGIDVSHDSCENLTGRPSVEEVQIQCLNMGIELLPYGQ